LKKTRYTVFLILLVAAAVAITGVQAPAQAELSDATSTSLADPMFIKFEGVDGESQDKSHKDWIDLQSFQQGMTKPGGGTGTTRRRGDVVLYDIEIIKYFDKSSPKLMEALATGTVFNMVQIEFTRQYPDGVDMVYLSYELRDVQITSYHVSMSSEDSAPMEEISFNYGKITVTYTEIDEMGKAKGTVEWSYYMEMGDR